MRVNRIDHINLRTPLLAETSAFYERLLGLKPGRPANLDPARNAWLYDEDGHPIVHINLPEPGEAVLNGGDTGRLHHVALDCSGHDEMVARLERLALEHRLNHVRAIDLKQIFVRDPNGVLLELNYRPGQN